MTAPAVLFTDAQHRKTLAAVRSLGRRGIRVAAGECSALALTFFSRYCTGRVVYPNPESHPEGFVSFLQQYLQQRPGTLLVPMDDAALRAINRHRDRLERWLGGMLPAPDRLQVALDKLECARAGRAAGLAVPEFWEPEEARRLRPSPPLLVRPRYSSGGRGITLVRDPSELEGTLQAVQARYGPVMVQRYVGRGDKYNVALLFDRAGRLRASFVERELRCYPPEWGPGTVQQSVWRPDLVAASLKLLRSLGWVGLAEVDFMEDPATGVSWFMEINPRFWASVQLAISSGVDFPHLYYLLATGARVSTHTRYRVGLRCRWLLPGELLYWLRQRRQGLPPDFWRWDRDTVPDIPARDDPGPVLGFWLTCLPYLLDARRREFVLRRESR